MLNTYSLDPADWEATVVQWLAPAGAAGLLQGILPRSREILSLASLMSPFDTLVRTAACHAFWKLPVSWLRQYGKLCGCELPEGGSLHETLFSLMRFCLPLAGDEALLEMMMNRFAHTDIILQLLESDIIECLDETSGRREKEAKYISQTACEDLGKFRRDVAAARVRVRAEKASVALQTPQSK